MNDPGVHEALPRTIVPLDRVEAMRLLAEVPVGRVVFTRNALPAVRPVNHLVAPDGAIVLCTRLTSWLTKSVRGNSPVVVAFEADEIDPERQVGWTVSVTGVARTLTDPERIVHYRRLLRPWVDHVMDTVITIEPHIVSGVRFVEAPSAQGDGGGRALGG